MSASSYAYVVYEWSYFAGKCTLGLVTVIILTLYTNQDRLLYIPTPPGFPKSPADNPVPNQSPGDWNIHGRLSNGTDSIPFIEENVETSDGKLIHTWLMLQPNSMNVPTLIYFHGNAGNMGFRLKNAALMYARCGINVLMMDYRGFGRSTGTPNELGLNIDADTVMQYAASHPKLKRSPLVAFGRSLGGAVSVSLAHRHPTVIKAVILENTFLSISAMVDILMPFLTPFKKLVLCIGWKSDEKIKKLEQPIMFISGDADQLVPPSHMKSLYESSTSSIYTDFFSVLGGGHNDTFGIIAYIYTHVFIYV